MLILGLYLNPGKPHRPALSVIQYLGGGGRRIKSSRSSFARQLVQGQSGIYIVSKPRNKKMFLIKLFQFLTYFKRCLKVKHLKIFSELFSFTGSWPGQLLAQHVALAPLKHKMLQPQTPSAGIPCLYHQI